MQELAVDLSKTGHKQSISFNEKFPRCLRINSTCLNLMANINHIHTLGVYRQPNFIDAGTHQKIRVFRSLTGSTQIDYGSHAQLR
jgi:hypothetical protein